jgi:hypothetical protein
VIIFGYRCASLAQLKFKKLKLMALCIHLVQFLNLNFQILCIRTELFSDEVIIKGDLKAKERPSANNTFS